MRGARGQATVDYLAVVLVIALVIGAAVALFTTTDLGDRIVAAFKHALCVVTGGPCDADEVTRPCVRASHEHTSDQELDLSIVHIGGRDTELREHLSDGTVAVTLVHDRSGGLVGAAGTRIAVRWGNFSRAVGSELRIAALAQGTSGRTWIVPDDAAADLLIERVRYSDPSLPTGPLTTAPVPAQTFSDRGGDVSIDLGASQGSLHFDGGEAYGERDDRASGERTVYVRNHMAGSVSASIGLAGGSAAAGLEERYGITLDRRGRPVDLEVLSSFDVSGAVSLPPKLAQVAGYLDIPTHGAEHVETEQHLDLTDTENGTVARAFLAALGHGSLGVKLTANALRNRLESDGSSRVRTYGVQSGGSGIAGHVGSWVLGAGGEVSSTDRSDRLRKAIVREPGGAWRADTACLPPPA